MTTDKRQLLIIAGAPEFAAVFLTDQLRYLKKNGLDVSIICSTGNLLADVQEQCDCKIFPVNIHRSINISQDCVSLLRLYRHIRLLSPDMIHTHTPKAGLLGTMAAWLNRVPVRIHTFHGLRSETLHGPKRFVVEAMERLTGFLATDCLAVSHSLRAELIARGICPARKLRVLGDGSCAGIDVTRFSSQERQRHERQDFRRAHRLSENTLLVTYIGRICHEKGLDTLIHAWKKIRAKTEAILFVAGPFDPTDPVSSDTLRAMCLENGILLQQRFVKDVPSVLAASDICVQPSFREGLGISALEAAAMGIPVVASQVTGLADAVRHNQTGILVPPNDSEALASALQSLISDAPLRRIMGASGRQFVVKHFNRDDVFLRLLDYYKTKTAITRRRWVFSDVVKQAVDCAAAITLLLLCAPLLFVVMAALRWHFGASAIFRQQRAGKEGKLFNLLKLRTMSDARDESGNLLPDRERLSTFGKWLRLLSIDELPQLWNVIRGDMSLVGPRPLLAEYLPYYTPFQAQRHEVKPGITGWAQIHGRNLLSWQQKFDYDVWYVKHRSIFLDFRIILLTFRKLFLLEGITPRNSDAMSDFREDSVQPSTSSPLLEV